MLNSLAKFRLDFFASFCVNTKRRIRQLPTILKKLGLLLLFRSSQYLGTYTKHNRVLTMNNFGLSIAKNSSRANSNFILCTFLVLFPFLKKQFPEFCSLRHDYQSLCKILSQGSLQSTKEKPSNSPKAQLPDRVWYY